MSFYCYLKITELVLSNQLYYVLLVEIEYHQTALNNDTLLIWKIDFNIGWHSSIVFYSF